MQKIPVQFISDVLSGNIPYRYQLLHRFDPTDQGHREAADAISGRKALAYLESRASSNLSTPHLGQSRPSGESLWIQGVEAGLLFWARTARSRPSWRESIALEVRDTLWGEGHALGPDSPWDDALVHAARLLGLTEKPIPLKEGQHAQYIQGIVGLTPGSTLSKDSLLEVGVALLRGLVAKHDEIYTVRSIDPSSKKVTLENNGGRRIQVPRTAVWPLGCSVLQSRRQKVVAYCLDAFKAAMSWSDGSGFETSLFFKSEAERLRSMSTLWSCNNTPT